ncbi:hypothetical protein AAOE16_18180 [Ekhidna sp. MALMAid0563]|uniref:hypothetical protein n=1 Tax=Ekhidna sp. MALMAid0563 TaxID=3143937 RepID=UPI0032DF54A7
MYNQLKKLSKEAFEEFKKGDPTGEEKFEWFTEHIKAYASWTYQLIGDARDATNHYGAKRILNDMRSVMNQLEFHIADLEETSKIEE